LRHGGGFGRYKNQSFYQYWALGGQKKAMFYFVACVEVGGKGAYSGTGLIVGDTPGINTKQQLSLSIIGRMNPSG
jgi:hypothetical protein